jgi:hypothetical protein
MTHERRLIQKYPVALRPADVPAAHRPSQGRRRSGRRSRPNGDIPRCTRGRSSGVGAQKILRRKYTHPTRVRRTDTRNIAHR